MSIAVKLRRTPGRLAAGAFVLNSGLNKLGADEETAAGMHGMAANAYPMLNNLEPAVFLKLLARGEVAIGAAVLLPIVPAKLAGALLTGFGAGLLGLYARTPGMHDEYYRPTQDGTGLAKDVWLFAIGAGLLIDACTTRKGKKKLA